MTNYILILISILFTSQVFSQTPIVFNAANNGQTISTSNGFVIDSGGQGGAGYSDNENTTITICPDSPGDFSTVVFSLFDLSDQDDDPDPNVVNIDYMTIYDGASVAENTLGTFSGNQLEGVVIQSTIQNISGCLTFVFTSNTIGTGSFKGETTSVTPCANHQSGAIVVNGITTGSIQVKVGDELYLQEQGSFAQSGALLLDHYWDFMDGITGYGKNVSHIYSSPGTFEVSLYVTANNGCIDTITKQITVVNDVTLLASNSFTPDGDEFNQTWNVVVLGTDIYSFDLKLFNRWGEMIWENNDTSIGWDGTYNGVTVEAGSYIWSISATDNHNDNKYNWSGHVNVLK